MSFEKHTHVNLNIYITVTTITLSSSKGVDGGERESSGGEEG